jgi:predicted transcriptional regulator of viral defense system
MYRLDKLLKSDQKLFHTSDLALLWGIRDKNTLYTAIKRYRKKGIFIPVHKGLYATVALDTIDPFRLGLGIIHRYAYVSCESVLTKQGIISQYGQDITFVTDKSVKFSQSGHSYRARKLADVFLYNDKGIVKDNGIMIASVARAVADMLYFDPHYHFDARKDIPWDSVKKIQKEVYHS